MGSKKLRDLLAITFVALFCMTHEMVFIWLLIGSMVLFHPANGSCGKSGRVRRKALQDANKYGVKIPRNRSVREKLNKIYQYYENSTRMYPHLQNHYGEILDNLWMSLANDDEIETWQYLLKSVLSDWPEQKVSTKQRLKDKLNEVGRLTTQWDEARQEAMGDS